MTSTMRYPIVFAAVAVLFAGLVAERIWRSADAVTLLDHASGPHANDIVSLGNDRYHVQFVFTTDGLVKLYVLGADAARVVDVETQSLEALVTPEGRQQAHVVALQAEPQSGDAAGRTSCFVGRLPPSLDSQAVQLSVPNLRIGPDRFHVTYRRAADDHATMPTAAGESEAQSLHLTAGGQYTDADIVANSRTTPSQKYRDFQARHDLDPQPGDLLCPITRTKANPACTWTVGGQEYQFCCPPCIDEFVRKAKESPDPLPPPREFVK